MSTVYSVLGQSAAKKLAALGVDPSKEFESRTVADEISIGLENWWHQNTGQAYLTPDYQHEEKLANTAYQRAAADMELAGLSKFGGVTPAGSPSPKSGNGLLATAMSLAQLRGQNLQNKENAYNFKKAKEWGVPTSAVGEFAKYDAAAKMLFGKSISDMVGDDGLIGMIKSFFAKGSNEDPGNPDEIPSSVAGAAIDAAQNVNQASWSPLQPVYTSPLGLVQSDVFQPVPFELPKIFAEKDGFDLKFEPFSKENFKEPSDYASFNKILGNDVLKDVDMVMRKMLNDNRLNTGSMMQVSVVISQHYGLPQQDVYQAMCNWIYENDGEIVARW